MRNVMAALAPSALLCLPGAAHGQERIDIVQIYENFLSSRVAALECNAVDKVTEQHFLSNQQAVTIRAVQALKERNSNLSDADLANRIVAAQNGVQAKVKQEVADKGCASDRIQQLLKLYKLQSTMSLSG